MWHNYLAYMETPQRTWCIMAKFAFLADAIHYARWHSQDSPFDGFQTVVIVDLQERTAARYLAA